MLVIGYPIQDIKGLKELWTLHNPSYFTSVMCLKFDEGHLGIEILMEL